MLLTIVLLLVHNILLHARHLVFGRNSGSTLLSSGEGALVFVLTVVLRNGIGGIGNGVVICFRFRLRFFIGLVNIGTVILGRGGTCRIGGGLEPVGVGGIATGGRIGHIGPGILGRRSLAFLPLIGILWRCLVIVGVVGVFTNEIVVLRILGHGIVIAGHLFFQPSPNN